MPSDENVGADRGTTSAGGLRCATSIANVSSSRNRNHDVLVLPYFALIDMNDHGSIVDNTKPQVLK